MITVKELRERYPNPVACECDMPKGSYCVLGAYFLSHDDNDNVRFPDDEEVADIFIEDGIFSEEERLDAMIRAQEIFEANDAGRFEEAWDLLENVLKRRPGQ